MKNVCLKILTSSSLLLNLFYLTPLVCGLLLFSSPPQDIQVHQGTQSSNGKYLILLFSSVSFWALTINYLTALIHLIVFSRWGFYVAVYDSFEHKIPYIGSKSNDGGFSGGPCLI